MISTIWKYPLRTTTSQHLLLPAGARILHVDVQYGVICLWALVDPSNSGDTELHTIWVVGTGAPVPQDAIGQGTYIGTVLQSVIGQEYVWHIFDQTGDDSL